MSYDQHSVKALLQGLREEEERLIVRGLTTQVPVFFDDAKCLQVCDEPMLCEMAGKAAQGGEAMQKFLRLCEELVVKQIVQRWQKIHASSDLAKTISERIKRGDVPEGWIKEGKGWWKIPEGWKP